MPYHHFTSEERSVLAAYLRDGLSLRSIAKKLQRSVSSISREIRVHSPDGSVAQYDHHQADFRAGLLRYDKNVRNPWRHIPLKMYVREKVRLGWSPEVISNRLMLDFPGDVRMRVSHEGIYQWIYAQRLAEFLPRGKPRRSRHRHHPQGRSHSLLGIGSVRSIHERPAIVATRSRYGDWESDSMQGCRISGAVLSVVPCLSVIVLTYGRAVRRFSGYLPCAKYR